MGWVKLDDGFFRNPKVVSVGKDAKFLYVAALCYCGANITDGRIPAGALRLLAAEVEVGNPMKAARDLVDAGLWIPHDDGGFQVHDYLAFNESSGERKAKQEAARDRMQRNRSRNVRANETRTSGEVPERFALPEEEGEESSEIPSGISGADAPQINDHPPAEVHVEPPNDPPKPLPEHGPAQRLVAWWCRKVGVEKPASYGKAVGAAQQLLDADIKTEKQAEELYEYCLTILNGGVTLNAMLTSLDGFNASRNRPPRPSGPPRAAPPRGLSRDELLARARGEVPV